MKLGNIDYQLFFTNVSVNMIQTHEQIVVNLIFEQT